MADQKGSARALFVFELKRQIKSPKNIAVVVAMLIVTMTFALYYARRDLAAQANIERGSNLYAMQAYITSELSHAQNLNKYPDTDKEQVKDLLAMLRQNLVISTRVRMFPGWDGGAGTRLRDELMAYIEQEKLFLTVINNPYIPYRYKETFEDQTTIAKMLERDIYMYMNGIDPAYTPYAITGYQFIYRFMNEIFPLLVPLALLLLCADTLAAESSGGSYKFLLLQPISRVKVFVCKAAAVFIYCAVVIAAVIFAAFLVVCVLNGKGDPRYPVEWDNKTETAEFSDFIEFHITYKNSLVDGYRTNSDIYGDTYTNHLGKAKLLNFIHISDYVFAIIPFAAAYILFLTVFGVFVSALSATVMTALTSSVCIALAYIPVKSLFSDGVLKWIPFSYSDINYIITTAGSGRLWALICFAAFLFVSGAVLFRKRDIVC